MSTDQPTIANILLVDDEPNILIALSFLMEQEGHQVQTATNGQAALSTLEAFIPNVVILDIMMPGIDGFEVARQIRQNSSLQDTHIIFLTAKGAKEDRREGYKNGGEIYLTKPFDNDELIECVNYALEL